MLWEAPDEVPEEPNAGNGVVRNGGRGYRADLGRPGAAVGAADRAPESPPPATPLLRGAVRKDPDHPTPRPVYRHALQGDEPPPHSLRPLRLDAVRLGRPRRGAQAVARRRRGVRGRPRRFARSGGAGDEDRLRRGCATLTREVF